MDHNQRGVLLLRDEGAFRAFAFWDCFYRQPAVDYGFYTQSPVRAPEKLWYCVCCFGIGIIDCNL